MTREDAPLDGVVISVLKGEVGSQTGRPILLGRNFRGEALPWNAERAQAVRAEPIAGDLGCQRERTRAIKGNWEAFRFRNVPV
jgi:hypothetical protein